MSNKIKFLENSRTYQKYWQITSIIIIILLQTLCKFFCFLSIDSKNLQIVIQTSVIIFKKNIYLLLQVED